MNNYEMKIKKKNNSLTGQRKTMKHKTHQEKNFRAYSGT